MRFVQRTIIGSALLLTSWAATAVPGSFQFTAAPGGFSQSGPSEVFPLPPLPASLSALVGQPIAGSFTFETERPTVMGSLPYEGQLVEVGALYLNPVLNFDFQIGARTFSFATAMPPVTTRESIINVTDLPPQLTAYPGDWYDVNVILGTGLLEGFENYRFAASLSVTEEARRIEGYDPVQPLLLTDAPWRFQFSLFDSATDIYYSLYTPVTSLQSVDTTQVPEPGTLGIFAAALLAFSVGRRRRT